MLLLTYFLIAVGISFLCSILEAVLLSITPAFITVVKSKNQKSGALLEYQKKNIDQSIGAILTLNTFAHTLGAAGVGAEAVKIFGEEYMFYISAILTILILVFSEIIPKTIGAYYWKQLARLSSRIIQILVIITYPLVYMMNKITALITSDKAKKKNITKEEFEATVSMGEEAGIIKEKDSLIIENILTLSKTRIKDILTPRKVVFALDFQELKKAYDNNSLELLDTQKLKEYSRIPIYQRNIDNIIGVVFSKELFYEFLTQENKDINKIIKPVYKINEHIPVSKLLDIFISRKEHLFIVLDQYDQTEGIVTLEDAIETLLGLEIVDELDQIADLQKLAKKNF
jgi:CBS domain containing-hemolysin-like protein